jgi:hypothetical protein
MAVFLCLHCDTPLRDVEITEAPEDHEEDGEEEGQETYTGHCSGCGEEVVGYES